MDVFRSTMRLQIIGMQAVVLSCGNEEQAVAG